jgi:NifU-like protein involved in Fe-S cluster formation
MDPAVIKYYRKLLRGGFEHAGTLEDPSIFLDPVAEGERRICGRPADYMKIYINIREKVIKEVRYLCLCDPTANVAVEVLSDLLQNLSIDEVYKIRAESILQEVGSDGEDLRIKSTALVELIQKGLTRYMETPP